MSEMPPDPSAPAPGAVAPGQEPIDPGVVELAGRVFTLARTGDAASLASYVDAGVPVNLTNEKGDTLVMLAAYHGHADAVRVLLERGAAPRAGHPTAVDAAVVFERPDLLELLDPPTAP